MNTSRIINGLLGAILVIGICTAQTPLPSVQWGNNNSNNFGQIPAHTVLGNSTSTPGPSSAVPLSQLGGGVNILDYGASTTATDNSVAINNAIVAAKALVTGSMIGGTGVWPVSVTIPSGSYTITNPINLTCINAPTTGTNCPSGTGNNGEFKIIFEGGGLIQCNVAGGICIDAIGSANLGFYNARVHANCSTSEPKIGLQIGQTINAFTGSTSMNPFFFQRPYFDGCYKFTAFYSFAGEQDVQITPRWNNQDTSSGGTNVFEVVLDSGAYWAPASSFVTVGSGSGYAYPFTGFTMIGGNVEQNPVGHTQPLWIWGTAGAKITNTYMWTGTNQCITFYTGYAHNQFDVPNFFDGDFQCEASSTTHTFLFDAQSASTNLNGVKSITDFKYRDNDAVFASTAIFAKASNVSTARLLQPQIHTSQYYNSQTPTLFDSETAWSVIDGRNIQAYGTYGYAPIVGSVVKTGCGSTCAVNSTFGSTPSSGFIAVIPGGSGIGSSIGIDMLLPWTPGGNASLCTFTPINTVTAWDAGVTSGIYGGTPQNPYFNVNNNSTTLTTGVQYQIFYQCF